MRNESHLIPTGVILAVAAGILLGCAAPRAVPSTLPAASVPLGKCVITVRFLGLSLKHGEGPVQVALWDSEENFMKDGGWLRGASIPVATADQGTAFEGLPPGRYAISAFHDTRNVGKLRQGAFGIPIDPWAISNAGASLGPPAWQLASFEVTGSDTLVELDFLHRPRRSP